MKWRVQISGDQFDLNKLTQSLKDSEIRVLSEEGNYFIEADQFQTFSESDQVYKCAEEIAAIISGIAKLAYGSRYKIRIDHIFKLRDDGKRDIFVTIKEALHVRVSLSPVKIITSDGNETTVANSDPASNWAIIAKHNSEVAKAFRLLGTDAHDWVGLYRLYEVIEQDVGGKKTIISLGWATEDSIRRFKHTANSPSVLGDKARHGKESTEPPKIPMDLLEARSLVEVILHNWLRYHYANIQPLLPGDCRYRTSP